MTLARTHPMVDAPRTCVHKPRCTTHAQCGERSMSPETPEEKLVYDFGWGDLRDHWQDCEDCGGTGKEEADGSGPPDDCPSCDGHGRTRWGSFYHADVGECAHCDVGHTHIAEMYAGGGCYDSGWVCLPCYIQHHREAHPDCELWRDAEAALDACPLESNSPGHVAATKEK